MTALERAYAELPEELADEATGIVDAGEWFDEERTNVVPETPTVRLTPRDLERLRALARKAA